MSFCISRTHTSESFDGHPDRDQKILIFEDRVLGWQLEIAEELRRQIQDKANDGKTIQHAGFALLSILFAYFEMIAQYMEGESSEKNPKQFFRKGLEGVFPKKFTNDQKELIYKRIRCGMYHSGLTKRGSLISGDYAQAIEVADDLVQVNPHRLSCCIMGHFVDYIEKLKVPSNAVDRCHFEKMFDEAMKEKE